MRERLQDRIELGAHDTFIRCQSIWYYGPRDVDVKLGAITAMWIANR